MKLLNRSILALCLSAVFLFSLSPIRLDDLFIYLAFGRKLFREGSLGSTDPFLFTIPHYAWHVWHEWLSYVIYYGAFLSGGFDGVIFLRALLVVSGVCLVWKAGERFRLAPLALTAIAASALLASSPRCFRDRSSIFSDLLTVLLLFLLTDSRFLSSRKLKWSILGIFLIWVQLHPSYGVGWFLLGLFISCHWRSWTKNQRLEWLLVLVSSLLVAMMNPVGFEAIAWPIRKFMSPEWQFFRQFNLEWQPTLGADFLSGSYKIFLCGWMALTAVVTGLNARKGQWFHFLSSLLLIYLGLSATRFLALTGFGLGALLATSLGQMAVPWFQIQSRKINALALVPPILLILFSVLHFPTHPLHDVVPVKATQFLLQLPPGNVFNDWELGGYLAWEFDGRQKIAAHGFISDIDLIKQNYYRFSFSPKDWSEVVIGNEARYFFWRRQSFEESRRAHAGWIGELVEPQWKLIYSDEAAVIFERTKPTLSPD